MNAKKFIDTYLSNPDQCVYDNTCTIPALTEEVIRVAKDNDLVVMYMTPMYDCLFKGAMEADIFCGYVNTIYISETRGVIDDEIFDRDSPNYDPDFIFNEEELMATFIIKEFGEYPWLFDVTIPHECFDTYFNKTSWGKYCRGVVFSAKDVKPNYKETLLPTTTNYEKIHNMSIDKLAVFLHRIVSDCSAGKCYDCLINDECSDKCSRNDILTWLKTESEHQPN